MFITVQDLAEAIRQAARDPHHELHAKIPREFSERLTPGKARDLTTHYRYIGDAKGVASLAELNITQLASGFADDLDRHLLARGRGAGVRRNTKNTYRLLREVAIALDLLPPEPKRLEIPKRLPIYEKRPGKSGMLRPPKRPVYAPYALKYENFNPDLKAQIDALYRFSTALIVRNRRGKAIDPKSTWPARLDHIERLFGAWAKLGFPPEAARLEDLIDPDRLERFVNFFLETHPEPTHTLKDILSTAHNVARNFFNNKAAADEISNLINQMRYVRIKDHEDLVLKVSANDLYHLGDLMYQQAIAYDHATYHRKSCAAIKYPQAQVAFHYSRALAIAIANACWFRRSNLFGIVWGQHLYFHQGKLFFRFKAEEMKSKEPHVGTVVDLWGGRKAYNQLVFLLNRYLEVRHHLVDKYLDMNPGAKPPDQLILNLYGKPYDTSGSWALFATMSRAYLGPEKEISPHSPRLIIPTYLMLEYDYYILGSIQAILDHKSIQTTEAHYLRMKRLMSGETAQKIIDERSAHEEQARTIQRMERMLTELKAQIIDK